MMATAIMRIQKHKSCSSLAAAERHGLHRDRLKHRAHPERSMHNTAFRKHKDMTLVQMFKEETKNMKIRKNAVLCYEIVFATSPEVSDQVAQNAELFGKTNLSWCAEMFGKDNVLLSFLEYDETSFHQHAYILCRVDGRLCAKHFTGDKYKLSQLQTSYAHAIQKEFPFLERGKCYIDCDDAKPRHQSLKEYYRKLELAEAKKITARVKEIER
ncbi:MAG: plasmid recombination protein [Clostridia bacterium]|nr:plasmid recombination protein [Clostridia bacterium]